LGSKVKTTCICPYYIDTGMFKGVQTKFPLLMPIMSEKYATRRIVNAILQEEAVCVLPWFGNLTILMRALLPTSVFDAVASFTGANNSMDHYIGRI